LGVDLSKNCHHWIPAKQKPSGCFGTLFSLSFCLIAVIAAFETLLSIFRAMMYNTLQGEAFNFPRFLLGRNKNVLARLVNQFVALD